MLERLIALASYGYFEGNTIGDVLYQWEAAGFFSYVLPFLLIFAVVYGILQRMKFFDADNKSISGIIAVVVALMALQFPYVGDFFREIFPRLGIGLAIILVALIAIGLFMQPKTQLFMLIGFLVFLVVMVKSFGAMSWPGAGFMEDNWPLVAGVVLVIVIISIIMGDKEKDNSGEKSVLRALLEKAGS